MSGKEFFLPSKKRRGGGPPRNADTVGESLETAQIQTQNPKADHAHRWRIDEPNGQESQGICRHCGEAKMFRNHIALDGADHTRTELRFHA